MNEIARVVFSNLLQRSIVATNGRWSEAQALARALGSSSIDSGAGEVGAPAVTCPSVTWWITRWLTKM